MKNISFKAFAASILSLVLVLSFSVGAFGVQSSKTSAPYVEKLKTEVRALLDQMNSQCAQAKAYREKSVSREKAISRDILIKAKYAKTSKDFESLKSSLIQTVATKKKLIDKLNTRLGLLDNIIAALRK